MRNVCLRPVLAMLAGVFLTALIEVACNPGTQQAPSTSQQMAMPAPAATEKVLVIFEGPWAIVDDPKDPKSVLVLAPKTKQHRDLYVAASNDSALTPGTYDLSVPAHGAAFSGPLDPSFAQGKIDARSLQHALDDKSNRYVIRLPKPEAYVAARRFRSRVGTTYPPDAVSEQPYATFVGFRYTVSSLNGFSLAGTPDNGTFNPLLLQLDAPSIRFAIEPAQVDDPKDMCNVHSREAFRDATKFLGVTLYVDFPNDAADCHKTDPQIPRTKAEAAPMSPLDRLSGHLFNNSSEELATIRAYPVAEFLASYLLHASGTACRAPIVFLTATP